MRIDETLACWGDSFWGQLDSVPSGTFIQVSSGQNHSCAVRTDDAAICWGWNAYGQATPPAGAFVQVSAGGTHSCGIKANNTLNCWGDNFFGQLNGVPSGEFVEVSAGGTHTCGVSAANTVTCWGDDTYGQATVPCLDTDGDTVCDDIDPDDDDDGCTDTAELDLTPELGGQRDPLNFWDFYDVNGDQRIDLNDTLDILAKFGLNVGDVGYDPVFDRYAPDSLKPWRTATDISGNGVDLTDALVNLQSFGHDCSGPP